MAIFVYYLQSNKTFLCMYFNFLINVNVNNNKISNILFKTN